MKLLDNNKIIGIFRITIGIYFIYKLFSNGLNSINLNPVTIEEIFELIGIVVGSLLTLILIAYYFKAGYLELKDRIPRNRKLRFLSIMWAVFLFIGWTLSLIKSFMSYQLISIFLTLSLCFLILSIIIKDIRIYKRFKKTYASII